MSNAGWYSSIVFAVEMSTPSDMAMSPIVSRISVSIETLPLSAGSHRSATEVSSLPPVALRL